MHVGCLEPFDNEDDQTTRHSWRETGKMPHPPIIHLFMIIKKENPIKPLFNRLEEIYRNTYVLCCVLSPI